MNPEYFFKVLYVHKALEKHDFGNSVKKGSGNIILFTFHVPELLGSFGSSSTENHRKKIFLTDTTVTTVQNCTSFILLSV